MRTTLIGLVAGMAAAGAAFAQSPAPAAAAAEDVTLAEVVVTALKVAEDVTKTPVAISVFTGEQLTSQGVTDINQLQNIAPSVNIGVVSRGANINIRGVFSSDITSKGEQAVSFNVDGVSIGRPQIMGVAFFDIDHVEVLRGPQGTLYGKSSTGGAINVITAKPTDQFDASASVTFGNFDTRRTQAMVNVPIADNFAVRLAVASNNRDGYLTPDLHDNSDRRNLLTQGSGKPLNDENNLNGRLSALWKFGEHSSLLLQALTGHMGGSGEASGNAVFANIGRPNQLHVYYNPYGQKGVDDHYSSYNAQLEMEFGQVHLTYTGGFLRFTTDDNFGPSTGDPVTNGSYNYNNYVSTNTYNVHELRLSNANPQALEYVVGANYYGEKSDEQDVNWTNLTFATPAGTGQNSTSINCTANAPNYLPGCNIPNPNIIGPTVHVGRGVFGQVNWHLNEAWKLTGGLRYSDDSMYRHSTIVAGPPSAKYGYYTDINGNPCYPGIACRPISAPGVLQLNDYASQAAKKVTWRVGVQDQFTDAQMWYASIATGYKAGSFNDSCPQSGTACTYGPEDMTAYEIGYKGKIRPNFELDSAVYFYDYSKFQYTQPTLIPGTANGVIIYTTLVPLKLYGWEGEVHWNLTRNDLLNATATYANGYYGPGTKIGFLIFNQSDANGARLDMLSPFTFTGSYEHRFPLGNGGNVSARVSSKISGGYYQSGFGGPVGARPYQASYTLSNFDLGYNAGSGKWEIAAFVRNVENKLQYLGAPGNDGTIQVSAPRTTGVRISMRY